MITIPNKRTDRLLHFKFSEKYSEINPYDYLETFQMPDWNVRIHEMLAEFFYAEKSGISGMTEMQSISNHTYAGQKMPVEWIRKRGEIAKMVGELLRANLIAVGSEGKNHDAERKPIDTAIIHHTSTKHSAKLNYIDALGLIRLYAKAYGDKENSEYGKLIWSNHVMNGRQTFIPYHYVIMRDGTFERCLDDGMIGWHAGNWEVNCKSIAICFMDDLEDSKPTEPAMKTAISIIKKHNIKSENIFGHREISDRTTCPGKKFYDWKFELCNESGIKQTTLSL
ncbi:MAG: N-acetylmuramoyl-L-alanine amidase [Nanoarchaeota archaeon]|nr:N-acetylmuramoyl-L-alanine amidase [Nanoarchaeota archaeon]